MKINLTRHRSLNKNKLIGHRTLPNIIYLLTQIEWFAVWNYQDMQADSRWKK